MIKIFCFINGGCLGFLDVVALAEDGTCLAGHLSSSIGFAKHDIGITSKWKHEIYEKHYPNGYELVWIDDARNSEEITNAVKLHNENTKDKAC